MKSRKIIWIAVIVLVAALVAATILYRMLSQNYAAGTSAKTTEKATEESVEKPVEEVPEEQEDTVPFEEEFENAQEQEPSVTETVTQEESAAGTDLELAADFTVEKMDGTQVKLSDMAGKPVIVNFWATWCPPCKMELPHFQEMYKEYGDQIQFMMVDLMDGSRETQTTLQAFLLAEGYTFPVFADKSGEASYVYQIYSIPMTICVTAEGELLSERIGALSKEELQNLIDSLLES